MKSSLVHYTDFLHENKLQSYEDVFDYLKTKSHYVVEKIPSGENSTLYEVKSYGVTCDNLWMFHGLVWDIQNLHITQPLMLLPYVKELSKEDLYNFNYDFSNMRFYSINSMQAITVMYYRKEWLFFGGSRNEFEEACNVTKFKWRLICEINKIYVFFYATPKTSRVGRNKSYEVKVLKVYDQFTFQEWEAKGLPYLIPQTIDDKYEFVRIINKNQPYNFIFSHQSLLYSISNRTFKLYSKFHQFFWSDDPYQLFINLSKEKPTLDPFAQCMQYFLLSNRLKSIEHLFLKLVKQIHADYVNEYVDKIDIDQLESFLPQKRDIMRKIHDFYLQTKTPLYSADIREILLYHPNILQILKRWDKQDFFPPV